MVELLNCLIVTLFNCWFVITCLYNCYFEIVVEVIGEIVTKVNRCRVKFFYGEMAYLDN